MLGLRFLPVRYSFRQLLQLPGVLIEKIITKLLLIFVNGPFGNLDGFLGLVKLPLSDKTFSFCRGIIDNSFYPAANYAYTPVNNTDVTLLLFRLS